MKRIQRKRSKGWRKPENAVIVDRTSRWGNPFRVGRDGDRNEVIKKYREWLKEKLKEDPDFLEPLKGKDLVCFCPLNEKCHADVILEFLERDNRGV